MSNQCRRCGKVIQVKPVQIVYYPQYIYQQPWYGQYVVPSITYTTTGWPATSGNVTTTWFSNAIQNQLGS